MISPASASDQCTGVRLLVEVPFTAKDVPLLLRTQLLWSRFVPCVPPSSSATDAALLFLFNGRCADSAECSRVQQLALHKRLRGCFRDVHVRDALLSSKEDMYDKLRRSAKWVSGPNHLFYRAVTIARGLGYTHMLQMEPDVVPFRAGWLERARCVAALSEAWVIGSALVANCTREETTGQCVHALPEDIADHINGNAIYAVGDASFARYLQSTRQGRLSRMPFDLALHVLRSRFAQSTRRRLLHRFQHSSFILNLGTTLPESGGELRAQHPSAFLVHSSELAGLDPHALQSRFPATAGAMPSRQINKGAAASIEEPEPELNLGPLRERAALIGGVHVALVTFIAGQRYLAMCHNHVLHLRSAGVSNYVLVALDSTSLRSLRAEREPVVDATQLISGIPEGGADRFGSSAFFAVNGARYRGLLAMLKTGISLFVLDLDVIVLRDPLPWLVRHAPGGLSNLDLLLQSDARDGTTGFELDPDLLERRLGLRGARNWTYVNGGTFFCRASPATIAFFQRIWRLISSSERPPNEQDVLNRELAASRSASLLHWGLLPPAIFPNGFVYFIRPIVAKRPVLVHANWIDGIKQKVYHLREAGLWALDSEDDGSNERLLSIGDGTDGGNRGNLAFAAHRRALRDALAVAQALNRTLVLPQLPVSRTSSARTRTLAHYFDYASFVRSFPRHREHGPRLTGGVDGAVKVHIDVGHEDAPPPASDYAVVRVASSSPNGLSDLGLRKHLAPFADARALHLWTPYRRFSGRFVNGHDKSEFAARVQHGLQPAQRLHFLVQYVHRSLRRAALGAFDCIDVGSDHDYGPLLAGYGKSAKAVPALVLLRTAARMLNSTRVLVVSDVGDDSAGLRKAGDELLGERALWMDDHVPPWYATDFDTPLERTTHARSMVELRVCARARRFVGNLAAPSTHAICNLRGSSKGGGRAGRAPPGCEDALGRTLPARWAFF